MPGDEWKVVLEESALGQLNRLDGPIRERIRKKLESMRALPPARALKRHAETWVQDVGGYRIMYLADFKSKTKTIVFIGDHKEYERKYMQMFK